MTTSEHSDMNSGQRHGSHGGHRYADADAELSEWHTTSVGARAASIEPTTGRTAFSADNAAEVQLRAAGYMSRGESRIARLDRIARTLAQLPAETRATLRLLYSPHGWDESITKAFHESLPEPPPYWPLGAVWAPLPAWGTSLVALAMTLPRARVASGMADSAATAEWLLERQAKIARIEVRADHDHAQGKHNKLVAALKAEAVEIRSRVVAEYEAVRVPMVRAAVAERRASMTTAERRRDSYRIRAEAEDARRWRAVLKQQREAILERQRLEADACRAVHAALCGKVAA
jgi:hypothetical protein